MAITQIADVVVPEILGDQVSAKFPDMLVIGNTNLVDVNPEFPLGTPGTQQKLPFYKRIGGFSALSEGVAMVPGKITTGSEYLTVLRAGSAFAVEDTAELVSESDPTAAIASQIGRRCSEYIDGSLVTQIEHSPNGFDQTNSGVQTNSNGTIDQNAIINAIMTLGDNYEALLGGGRIIMHSKVYNDLLKLGAIQNQYQSGMDVLKTGTIPTIWGIPIQTSDRVTTTVDSASKVTYHSYIVGPGALMLGYQRKCLVEFDRDILLQATVIASTVHFAPHLYGWDDKTSAVVAEQNKSIHAVVVKSY
jgi:hypothetical protein